MKKSVPPKVERFPAAKQRRLDHLLEKNSEGTITAKEKARLFSTSSPRLEALMVANARRLADFSHGEAALVRADAVPVTVWVQAQPAERYRMAHAEAYRELVVKLERAACEYCRLLQAATGVRFHIEHLVPRSQGGATVMGNLALSCPGCNLAKAARTSGEDLAGQVQPLFNPRDFDPWLLGWHLHFALDRGSGMIVPRTPTGEASVRTLQMNDPLRVFARKLRSFSLGSLPERPPGRQGRARFPQVSGCRGGPKGAVRRSETGLHAGYHLVFSMTGRCFSGSFSYSGKFGTRMRMFCGVAFAHPRKSSAFPRPQRCRPGTCWS